MESVYHIVAICVNETSWAHAWRLRSRYLGMGYDTLLVLATGEMPVSVGQFGYRCDSCELVPHGYCWITEVQCHA
jgi:hypothetical protein